MPDLLALDPRSTPQREAWQELWTRAPMRTPFTHVDFVEDIASATARVPHLLAVEDDGRLVAGAVLYSAPRRTWAAGPAPLTRYTGVLLDPAVREGVALEGRSALDVLLRGIRQRFRVAALSLDPSLADVRPLQWHGFDVAPRYTYRLDPGQAYEPAKNARKHLRRAAALRVESVPRATPELVRLLSLHYRQQNRSAPLTDAALASLLERLGRAGLVSLHLVRDERGEALAAQALLERPAWRYAWLAGSTPGPAMTVLTDALVRRAAAAGAGVDFLGANLAPIAQFKRAFGGALVPHYHATSYRPALLRAVALVRPLV